MITQQKLNKAVVFIQQASGEFRNATSDEAEHTLGSIKTKGTSYEKADITLDFNDEIHHINQGVSVKSFLGSSPTLLNASSATNFIFEVTGLAAIEIDAINAIESRSKIKDRLAKISVLGGVLQFVACENKTYESNLRKADSAMPAILADALLSFFKKETSNRLSDYKPVNVKLDADEIHCRLRDFIKYTVFGIFPSVAWDGELSANGAILVKNDGELVFYHTNHEKTLKDYFYQHCFFDTPSSTRHRFGRLYKEGSKLHFKLNLQLRLAQ